MNCGGILTPLFRTFPAVLEWFNFESAKLWYIIFIWSLIIEAKRRLQVALQLCTRGSASKESAATYLATYVWFFSTSHVLVEFQVGATLSTGRTPPGLFGGRRGPWSAGPYRGLSSLRKVRQDGVSPATEPPATEPSLFGRSVRSS